MSEHTPGPWTVMDHFADKTHDKHHIVSKPAGYGVAMVQHSLSGKEATKEEDANARLIAAAPGLLDALNYLLEQTVDADLSFGIALTEGEADARAQALAAIAKAKGETDNDA